MTYLKYNQEQFKETSSLQKKNRLRWLLPCKDRWKLRSLTYLGRVEVMAN